MFSPYFFIYNSFCFSNMQIPHLVLMKVYYEFSLKKKEKKGLLKFGSFTLVLTWFYEGFHNNIVEIHTTK